MKFRIVVEFEDVENVDLADYDGAKTFEDAARIDIAGLKNAPEYLLDRVKEIKIEIIDNDIVIKTISENDKVIRGY